MRVFIDKTETESNATTRVINALMKYAPSEMSFTENPTEADLIIISVVGRLEHIKERIKKFDKSYAIIQYILRGSKNPNTADWMPVWENAQLVWSYYNLKALCLEDGITPNANFYHAPLGVDKDVFKPGKRGNKYLICTSGLLYMTESVRECIKAANGRRVVHLGPALGRVNVDCVSGLNDNELAGLYNNCEFVAGLRRTQGFELPAAEGIMCGARPIMFDRPHYTDWFQGLAEFIPENSREDVIKNLKKIFDSPRKPVTDAEIEEAARRFDWNKIISGFWEKINGYS